MNHFSNDLHEFWPHNAPVDLWSFDAGAATAPGAQGRGLPRIGFFCNDIMLLGGCLICSWTKTFPSDSHGKNIWTHSNIVGFSSFFPWHNFEISRYPDKPHRMPSWFQEFLLRGLFKVGPHVFGSCLVGLFGLFGPLPGFRLFQNLRLWDFDLAQLGPGSILRVFWPKNQRSWALPGSSACGLPWKPISTEVSDGWGGVCWAKWAKFDRIKDDESESSIFKEQ